MRADQAIRIPREFELETDEVIICREDDRLVVDEDFPPIADPPVCPEDTRAELTSLTPGGARPQPVGSALTNLRPQTSTSAPGVTIRRPSPNEVDADDRPLVGLGHRRDSLAGVRPQLVDAVELEHEIVTGRRIGHRRQA